MNDKTTDCAVRVLATKPAMVRICNFSCATIDRAVKVLKDSGHIRRVGDTRCHWEVVGPDKQS